MKPIGLNYDNKIENLGNRVTVMDYPVALPGRCAICGYGGGDSNRRFIDFGLQLDYYGAVNFCTECIREVAESIGYVPREFLDKAEEEIVHLRTLVDNNTAVADVVGRLRSDLATIGIEISKFTNIESTDGEDSGSTSGPVPGPEPEPVKPTSKRGSKDVRSTVEPKLEL